MQQTQQHRTNNGFLEFFTLVAQEFICRTLIVQQNAPNSSILMIPELKTVFQRWTFAQPLHAH